MTIYASHQPYTYLIQWSSTGMKYYGVRYAKGCNPSEFWKSYFTSSKYVQDYILEHGNPDILQIRKTFTTQKRAREWESRVLRTLKVSKREDYLNKNEGSLHVNWEDPEIRKRHRDAVIESANRPLTKVANSAAQKIAQNKPEQKEKIRASSKSRWEDEEYANKMRQIHLELWKDENHRLMQSSARKMSANRPDVVLANSIRNTGSGNARYDHTLYHFIHEKSGLEEICTRHDLKVKYGLGSSGGMSLMINGKTKSSYGWKLKN